MVDLPEQERTLDEDDFYSFMSETYDRCIKLGLQPERLSHDLKAADRSLRVGYRGTKYPFISSNR